MRMVTQTGTTLRLFRGEVNEGAVLAWSLAAIRSAPASERSEVTPWPR
jgi:hypothetical protein